jgi:hypothetical protein
VDAAWVGVFGTLLGTVVGALGAFLIARWQAHRDDRFRYALDKRQLYARFISEATDYRHDLGLTRLRGRAMREEGIKMGDPKYYDPYPVADLSRVKAIFGEVSWLAPADVVSAARNLVEALTNLGDRWETVELLPDDPLPSDEQWALDTKLVDAAFGAFHTTIKQDLAL